ncbi:MAG: class II aldolase [Firmicutes bacterium]|nr:class II aldolase [Bacillota bacterium]
MDRINELVTMSHKYGSNPALVLAGGGNTSYKNDENIYIKGSGTALATIEAEGFVKMDRTKLALLWQKNYSSDEKTREAQVLADMMAAKCPGEEAKRPSVETLLHNLLAQRFVLHLHPAMVNGITCGQEGKEVCARLFPEAVWIESTKPGYILALLCKEKIDAYKQVMGKEPQVLFLQNHGVFVAADEVEEIDVLMDQILNTIRGAVKQMPNRQACEYDAAATDQVKAQLAALYGDGAAVEVVVNEDVLTFAASKEAFEPVAHSFTPDHIVYCKTEPIYLDSAADLAEAFKAYEAAHGFKAKIVVIRDLGLFACGASKKDAQTAAMVFEDAIDIAVYSQSFGGALPLEEYLVEFIANWEVESYRAKVSSKA